MDDRYRFNIELISEDGEAYVEVEGGKITLQLSGSPTIDELRFFAAVTSELHELMDNLRADHTSEELDETKE